MDKQHKNKLNREYYHRNKERINFKRRGGAKRVILTEEERKQKEKEYNDLYAARIKQQPHKVYLLVDYNYVGTTQSLSKRFAQHRYASGFNCSNYKILFESFDREECLKLEKELHDKGYNGRNKHASYR